MTTRPTRKSAMLLGVALGLLAWAPATTRAQATVTAYTGQSCAGTRATRNLACNSTSFAQLDPFPQPAPALTSCLAGQVISLDVVAAINPAGTQDRYDGAVFFGERGNDPGRNDATQSCSLGLFPTAPAPFRNGDGDGVGEFRGNTTVPLTIRGVSATCTPAAGSNVLRLPYTLVYDTNNTPDVTYATVTAARNSRCVADAAAQVPGVIVQGWLRLTVQTTPDGDPQPFAFTASGSATPSPASFSLSDGATQLVQLPLSPTGGTQTLQLDEALVPGWSPTASITCTSPSGGAAAYVTLDGPSRRITATLDATNHGAICTLTNVKEPPSLLLVKSADVATARPGDVVTYTLVVQNGGPGVATGVRLSSPLGRHLAWGVDAYGPGASFQFTDGVPASGLAPGAPVYSDDGGATWTLLPASGGGGAPAGYDGRVTDWTLPMIGTMPAGGQFTITFKAIVR